MEVISFIPIPYTEVHSTKPNLMQYMNTNIYDFAKTIEDLFEDTEEEMEDSIWFRNDAVTVNANRDTEEINYFGIEYDCGYSIAGVEYGMSFQDAYELLKHAALELQIDEPDFKRFAYQNGTKINIHASEEDNVDIIFVYTLDKE